MKNNDWKIKKNVEKKDEKIIPSYWQWYTLQKAAVWFSKRSIHWACNSWTGRPS